MEKTWGKSKAVLYILCSFILGGAYIAGSWFSKEYSPVQQKQAQYPSQDTPMISAAADGPLLTIQQTADYLHLTTKQVITIIMYEQHMLDVTHSYEGTMFPWIKINGQMYIVQNKLEQWMDDAASQRRDYEPVK
jgi:hypothetical protein